MGSLLFKNAMTLVRGGGDLASGAVYRLHRAGFPIIVAELPAPRFVRRAVSYGEAVYSDSVTVEGLTARLADDAPRALSIALRGEIAVLVDKDNDAVQRLSPPIVVDARMEKNPLDTRITDAPLVVALGPGYIAGQRCHAVIETNRGHRLGRVIWQGPAEPDTGTPGPVAGHTATRVLRAPADGLVESQAQIGDIIEEGAVIATVGGQAVHAPFKGLLRGLVHPSVRVTKSMKIGDLDPRMTQENYRTISDKALAIGGGVVEAALSAPQIRPYLEPSQ